MEHFYLPSMFLPLQSFLRSNLVFFGYQPSKLQQTWWQAKFPGYALKANTLMAIGSTHTEYSPTVMHNVYILFLFCCDHSWPMSSRVTSLALGQSYDCPSTSEATLKIVGTCKTSSYSLWISGTLWCTRLGSSNGSDWGLMTKMWWWLILNWTLRTKESKAKQSIRNKGKQSKALGTKERKAKQSIRNKGKQSKAKH